jgi:tetratricopeptide (TPR) repeat protein
MSVRTKTTLAPKAETRAGSASWKETLRRPAVLCVLLAVTTLAVFLQVARHDYVNYDDSDYITANAHVESGLKWANVVWAFKTGHASNWHPLTWMSHMLDIQLFGEKPVAQHLVSLGFHIVNTLLLFLVLRRMTGATWRSGMVAALFALHPLHVESVAWISERKDVLSAFFFLLTLGAYARYVECRRQNAEGRMGQPDADAKHQASRFTFHVSRFKRVPASAWYLLALVCFALGLMSKPMLVTLPFVLLLLDFWPLRRMQRAEGERQNHAALAAPHIPRRSRQSSIADGQSQILLLLLEKVPFFLLAAASSVVTFIVQRKGGAVSTSLSLGARVANAVVSYMRYIGKMLWPRHLSVLYPHPGHWPAWEVAASAVSVLAVSAAVILLARRRPYLAVGWLWFCGTLVPVIGLVQVGIQSMADRYTYLPLIGLFIMLVWGIAEMVPERPWRAEVLGAVGVFSLAACALLTARQVQIWQDSAALFGHAVRVTRDNYLAYNNLGFYLSGLGKKEEAMENYRMSLKINPAYEDALNNVGYALAGQKKYSEAIPLYEAALRIRPNHAEVHNNLGNALSETGKIDEAIQHYLIALKQNPDHAEAHNNLGIALAMKGKLDEAVAHFQAAIRSKPNYASAHSNLGNAFAVQHKLDEAIREYREALRLKPDDAQAHNNLGNVLAEQGKMAEAITYYREALRLNADNPEAQFNLGLALLHEGKREEGVAHLTEAVRLKPDYAEARRQLNSLTGRSGP